MNKYLGIDLGSVTAGIAISESGVIAENHSTFRFEKDDYETCKNHIIKLAKDLKITTIVIGLPKHMNNDLGDRAEISIKFKEMLEEANPNLKVILWDERLSTRSALKPLQEAGLDGKKKKALKDELAAKVILQSYLDSI